MNRFVLLLAMACFGLPASAQVQQDDLEKLVGRWVHDGTGEVIKIEPTFIGWELWTSRRGQFALVLDGTAGAHIKMSGRGPTDGSTIECFYYVSMTNGGDTMVWNRRAGPPAECAEGKYSHTLSGKTRSEEIAEVRIFRMLLNAQAAVSPVDMTGVEVIYFDRSADGGKVRKALESSSILHSLRNSESLDGSNAITCQRDVPIGATKYLARTLIQAKVPIRLIRPTQYQQFSKRLTVESLGSWAVTRPLITLAQIDAMTSCNIGNLDGANLVEPISARPSPAPPAAKVKVTFPSQNNFPLSPVRAFPAPASPPAPAPSSTPPVTDVPVPQSGFPKVPITVNTGLCPDMYNVTARFWSPTLNAWQWTNMKGVQGQDTFRNADGTLVTTSTREVYFFVRNLSTNQPTKLAGPPVVFPSSDVTYYKRGPDLTLNCR